MFTPKKILDDDFFVHVFTPKKILDDDFFVHVFTPKKILDDLTIFLYTCLPQKNNYTT